MAASSESDPDDNKPPPETPDESETSLTDEADSVDPSDGDRRFVLISGAVFLVIMTIQYLSRVFDRPEPLPWQRGETFQSFRVDINTATWIEWSQLEGIGPSLAHRIVAYREQYGPFQSVDEIQQVEGIGPTTLDRIRPWLTIDSKVDSPRSEQ